MGRPISQPRLTLSPVSVAPNWLMTLDITRLDTSSMTAAGIRSVPILNCDRSMDFEAPPITANVVPRLVVASAELANKREHPLVVSEVRQARQASFRKSLSPAKR